MADTADFKSGMLCCCIRCMQVKSHWLII